MGGERELKLDMHVEFHPFFLRLDLPPRHAHQLRLLFPARQS